MTTGLTVPAPAIPAFVRLTSRQQIAVDCVHCARYLGASGRMAGEVRHVGYLFVLWACDPGCRGVIAGRLA